MGHCLWEIGRKDEEVFRDSGTFDSDSDLGRRICGKRYGAGDAFAVSDHGDSFLDRGGVDDAAWREVDQDHFQRRDKMRFLAGRGAFWRVCSPDHCTSIYHAFQECVSNGDECSICAFYCTGDLQEEDRGPQSDRRRDGACGGGSAFTTE